MVYSSHEGELTTLAASDDTRNDVAYTGVPGITNAETDLGGRGQNTITFRNRDDIGLTLEYFLDSQGDVVFLDPRAPSMYGPQPGNVEHILKLAGSYAWENGFEVGAVEFWNSGTIYSRTFLASSRHLPVLGDPYEFGGVTAPWVEDGAVGTSETGSYGTLDLRAKYTMDVFDDRYQAEFFLDIFNALDDQASIRHQDLSAGGDGFGFGQANNWVEPRRFYLGARLSV